MSERMIHVWTILPVLRLVLAIVAIATIGVALSIRLVPRYKTTPLMFFESANMGLFLGVERPIGTTPAVAPTTRGHLYAQIQSRANLVRVCCAKDDLKYPFDA